MLTYILKKLPSTSKISCRLSKSFLCIYNQFINQFSRPEKILAYKTTQIRSDKIFLKKELKCFDSGDKDGIYNKKKPKPLA